MARIRHSQPAASRGVGLLAAACVVLCAADAIAQSSSTFAPSDPRAATRFQPAKPRTPEQVGPPLTFSKKDAQGTTGFDSTNRKKKPARAARTPGQKPAAAQAQARAPEPIAPAQLSAPPSHFDAPPPPLPPAATNARAQMPETGAFNNRRRKKVSDLPDPYAPLGMHAGSFLLFPAIELSGGYNSNPSQSQNGDSASFYTLAPELRVQSEWSRHELKADLRGSYTGYEPDGTPSLSRPFFRGDLKGRVDVTRNTEINLGAVAQAGREDPGSPNLQAGLAELPVYTIFGGSAGLTQRFNRLELSGRGEFERRTYGDSDLVNGTTASNEDRNYDQYGGAFRAAYELTPGVKPFAEVGADTRVHDLETDFSGYRRNSDGFAVRVGSTFELSRLLIGEVSLGWVKREYEDPRLQELSGFIGDGSLSWLATALTTVRLTAKSSVGESNDPGVSGILYRDIGMELEHSFRRWLVGSVRFGMGFDDFVGSSREDERYAFALGLTYKMNRNVQWKGEFRQEWRDSNQPGNDYDASIFTLGVRFQQ